MRTWNAGLLCAAVGVAAAISVSAVAQGTAGVGQGRAGGGQRRGGQGRGGITLTAIPAGSLAMVLKLTDDQKTKIAGIQEKFTKDVAELRKPAADGTPPNNADIFPKIQEINAAALKDIGAVLTDDQKAKVPDVLKEFTALRGAGIPAGVVGDLKLTADQKTKIADIAKASAADRAARLQELQGGDRAAMRQAFQDMQKAEKDKVTALLTDTQKTTLEKYLKDHPQPAFGAGGRRPGGAPGTPPPPPLS